MGFVDPDTVHNPTSGAVATAAWGDTVNADLNYFNDPPRVKVYRNADYGINDATSTMVAWNAEEWDTDTMHSTSVNTTRLTATTAGRYHVQGRIVFAGNATATVGRRVKLWLNGNAGTLCDADIDPAPSGAYSRTFVSTTVQMAAGDYVELEVYQDSGGSLNVIGAALGTSERSWFEMTWQGTD